MPGDDERTVDVDGRAVHITRPDKVYFPGLGATKFDLVSYYLEIGSHLLNTAGGRPAMLQRFPDGAAGKSFYQKRIPAGAPDWLQSTTVATPNGTTSNALVVADRRPRRVGRQHRLSGPAPVALSRRRPDPRRRAAHRPRPDHRHRIRRSACHRAALPRAARRARAGELSQDHGQPRVARVRPARSPLGLGAGPGGSRRPGTRARAPVPR